MGPKCGWAGDDLERPGDGAEGLFCVGFLAMEESRRRRRNKQEAPAGASTSTEDICALGALHHCCGCLKCPHLGAYTAQEPSDPHEWPWVFNFNFYLFWARIDCGEQAGGRGLAKHSSIHVIAPALLSSAGGLGKIIGVLGQGQGALGALLSEEGEKKIIVSLI